MSHRIFPLMIAALVLPMVLCHALEARAQYTVTPGTEGYETVARGVSDISLENVLLVRYISDAEGAGLDAAYIGGIAYRYFLINNLALGVSLNVLYQSNSYTAETTAGTIEEESEDLGFVGFITANYYVRLGNSLFFKPGLGLGGLYGRRTVPTPGGTPGQYTQMALYGGTAKIDLGFVFFASRHFNLRAGLDIIFRIGAANPADDTMETQSFFSVDAGFNIGLGYTF